MKIQGIIPALHTAFDEEGELDLRRQRLLVERLISDGVGALFAGGSTGEFPFLDASERERLSAGVVEAAAGRVPVIVHAGAAGTREAVRLARHASRCGAQAVASLPPYYYRVPDAEVVDHFRAVAEAAGPLPFFAYHLPERTGVPLTAAIIEGLREIPTFAGLKWSDPDLFAMRAIAESFGDRATVLSGKDEILFPALTSGAGGAVGSTYNFLAPWFVRLWHAFRANDYAEASRLQTRASRVIAVVLGEPDPSSASKEATRWAGVDCGPSRPPFRRYSQSDREAFCGRLEAAGLPEGGLSGAL